jgi:hypothetical protein
MAFKLALVNALPRMTLESASPTIYDQNLLVVAAGAGAGQINGPIAAGTSISLPGGQTYTGAELEVYIGPDRLRPILDYAYASSTQIQFTFQLTAGDNLRFRIDRAP